MKHSPEFSLQCHQFMVMVLSISFTCTVAGRLDIPRLSPTRGTLIENPELQSSAAVSDDLQTFYYPQTLDHFNYQPQSYATFQQRYVMNFKHWSGANDSAPILAYLGAEAPLDSDLTVIGFLNDNAIRFNALLDYIEKKLNAFYSPVIVIGGSYGGSHICFLSYLLTASDQFVTNDDGSD
ncbi:putative Serine carboxypeptidase S28 family protein [Hibiscus syriacus]|uniref:Serine carboxypeptidase S28 family protein n=1 Tax=Hibiscus syriacus TaxID=106335 RepID=A0A6A3CB54_HIBSY|nr:putative Serine carboxypeptidase S28 family protein [Hibiscus syriacus]